MRSHPTGPLYGLLAAVLFGASTPLAKLLLEHCGPIMLAGLLYLGSGCGLGVWHLFSRGQSQQASLGRRDVRWLGLAILCGGIVAPILLMIGLRGIGAATGSLLLNLEGVFTALLAWFLFRENFDRRIFLGMVAILAGAVLLAWPSSSMHWSLAALPIAGACLAWALDNNFTRHVSAADPVQIAGLKGFVAGVVNITIALALGEHFPSPVILGSALLLGLLAYGVSLTCFVLALRYLGTARTGAYFSTAPFVGAALSLLVFARCPASFSGWLGCSWRSVCGCIFRNITSTPIRTSRSPTATSIPTTSTTSTRTRRTPPQANPTRTITCTPASHTGIRTTRTSTTATSISSETSAGTRSGWSRSRCETAVKNTAYPQTRTARRSG